MRLKLLTIVFVSVLSKAQVIVPYSGLKNLTTSTAAYSSTVRLLGTGIVYHSLTWNVSGSPLTCTVQVDSSIDGQTWNSGDVIPVQNCTSNGASSVINLNVNYIRVNVSVLTGAGTVSATWVGYTNNPSGGSIPANVVSQSSNTCADNAIPLYSGTSGELVKCNSGYSIDPTTGQLSGGSGVTVINHTPACFTNTTGCGALLSAVVGTGPGGALAAGDEVTSLNGCTADNGGIPVKCFYNGTSWVDMGGASGGGATAAVTFAPVAGTYATTQSVALSSATAGATICYTTDGSTPAESTPGTCSAGSTYSTAISVASTETVKAIAGKSGLTNSSVTSATYTIAGGGTAVALDSANVKTWDNGTACTGSPCTTTFASATVGSQSNREIFFALVLGSSQTVSGVTYGGVSMTSVCDVSNAGGDRVTVFRLNNPTAGAADFIATFSGSATAAAGFVPMYNVNQTTPIGTPVTNTSASTSNTATVSSATNDMELDFTAWSWFSGGPVRTASPSGTSIFNYASQTAFGYALASSQQAGAASVGTTWTYLSAVDSSLCAVDVKHP